MNYGRFYGISWFFPAEITELGAPPDPLICVPTDLVSNIKAIES